MRTHVEFRSSEFTAEPGEDEAVNPGRWGKSLAQYLQRELSGRGLVAGEPYAEDWGWAVPLQNDEFPLWVGRGNYEEYPDGFLVFIEPSKPKVRRWLKTIDTTSVVEKVASALDATLRANSGIREGKWWDESGSAP